MTTQTDRGPAAHRRRSARLAYRGFSYTKETHERRSGPWSSTCRKKEHVNLPVWLGVGAVVVGGGTP